MSAMHRRSKRLLVHVGMPKTGSTSIQMLLAKWPAFLERSGVHVPAAGLLWLRGHSKLLEKHRYDPEVRDPWAHRRLDSRAWGDLRDELTRVAAGRFVISSEFLGDGRPQSLEWAEAFAALGRDAGVDVEVFAYVRPQYQWLEARYAERVRNGWETRPFRACLQDCLASRRITGDALASPYASLDYNGVFNPWREVFGGELNVYTLDEARHAGGLVRHFLHVVGASDLANVVSVPHVNQRPGAKLVEISRLTSAALDAADLDVPTKSLLLDSVLAELPTLLEDDVPFRPLSDAQIHAVIERYADSNAKFADEYGLDAAFHPESAKTGSPRPARVEWQDIDRAERDRVRRHVLDRAGVDLDTGLRRPRLEARWGRPSVGSAVASSVILRGLRLSLSQAKSIRYPSDVVPFFRWLRWYLMCFLRRCQRHGRC